PSSSSVVGGNREDLSLARATNGLKFRATDAIVKQDTRLNGSDRDPVDERWSSSPRFSAVGAAFEVNRPLAGSSIRLVASRSKKGAVGELHRLVLDWAQNVL